MPVTWRVLGGIAPVVDGEPVVLAQRARRLLGVLLLDPSASWSAAEIAGTPDDRATTAVRVAVKRLRDQLEWAGAGTPITRSGAGYRLDVAAASVDHLGFRDHLRRAETSTWPESALGALDDALALWRGTPFGDLGDDVVFEAVASDLDELHRRAVDLWGQTALRCGLAESVIGRLRAAVEDDPLREQRWHSLMLGHYRAGNQADALRQFQMARRAFAEIGLEVSPDLRLLEAQILAHEPSLRWMPLAVSPARPLRPAAVTIGRDDEIADVLDLVGRHRVVTLIGLGGVGKSTLAREVAARSARPVVLVAACGPARTADDLLEIVGETAEVNTRRLTPADVFDAVVDRLRGIDALLILDTCEHLVEPASALAVRLVEALPSLRVLATSRVELPIPGAGTLTVGPLPTGTAAEPGAGALLVADAAGIRRSQLADRWADVATTTRRAGGIPLALELLGAALADGSTPDDRYDDPLASATAAALFGLPTITVGVLTVLAGLPDGAGDAFLARLVGRSIERVRSDLSAAVRVGLVLRDTDAAGVRSRLLDPVREFLLRPWSASDHAAFVREVVCAATELGRESSPSLALPHDVTLVGILDDENRNVRWAIDAEPDDRLRLVAGVALGRAWRSSGRTVQTDAILDALVPFVQTLDPVSDAHLIASYWTIRSFSSPSLAARVPYVDHLTEVVDTLGRHGDTDLAVRAAAECAIGLGWSGRVDEAVVMVDRARCLMPDPSPWATANADALDAMAQALRGDPGGAGRRLLEISDVLAQESADDGDWLSNRFIAASFFRIAGDDAALELIFSDLDRYEHTRFGRYPWAALLFERARFALDRGDLTAGPMLRRAFAALSRYGEHRTAAVCRREVGAWRLDHGDAAGLFEVVVAARTLRSIDPPASAVALAIIAARTDGALGDRVAAEAVVAEAEPGGLVLDARERARIDAVRRRATTPFGPKGLGRVLDRLEASVDRRVHRPV